MNLRRLFAFGVVATLLLASVGGVGVVAAHENDNPDHPACEGDKYKISSEGSNKAGEKTSSKWWVKPPCTDEPRHLHNHVPDLKISIPESAEKEYNCVGRINAPHFADNDPECR